MEFGSTLVDATIVFVVFTRTRLELTSREAYGFIALDGAFVVWMGLETVGVIETIKGIRSSTTTDRTTPSRRHSGVQEVVTSGRLRSAGGRGGPTGATRERRG